MQKTYKSRRYVVIFAIVFAGCATAGNAPDVSNLNTPEKLPAPVAASTATPSVSSVSLTPVNIALHLNQKQTRFLDAAIPPGVREVLERADTFQLLFEESVRDADGNRITPNETQMR